MTFLVFKYYLMFSILYEFVVKVIYDRCFIEDNTLSRIEQKKRSWIEVLTMKVDGNPSVDITSYIESYP